MIGPTDLLHPSPAPHFKTFQVFLIKLGYPDEYNYFFQRCDETEATKLHKKAFILSVVRNRLAVVEESKEYLSFD
jgi:hypothetical protein